MLLYEIELKFYSAYLTMKIYAGISNKCYKSYENNSINLHGLCPVYLSKVMLLLVDNHQVFKF